MILARQSSIACRNAPALPVKPTVPLLPRPVHRSKRSLQRRLFASVTYPSSVGSSTDEYSVSNGTSGNPNTPPSPPSFPNPLAWLLPLLLSGACAAAAALSHLGHLVIPAPIPHLLAAAVAMTLIAAAAALQAVKSLQLQVTNLSLASEKKVGIEKLQAAEQQLTQEQARAAGIASQLQEAEKKLVDQKKQAEEVALKLQAAEKSLQGAQATAGRVGELQAELEGKNSLLAKLEQQVDAAKKMAAEAVKKQVAADQKAQEAVAALQEGSGVSADVAGLKAAQQEAKDAAIQVLRLEDDVKAALSARQQAETQLKEALKLVDKMPQLERDLATFTSSAAELQVQLQAATAAKRELEVKLQGAQQEAAKVFKLEGEVKALAAGKKEVEGKLKGVQQELTKVQAQVKSQGSGPTAREAAMAAELNSLKSKMESEVRQRALDKKEMNLLKSITDDTTAELKAVKRDTAAREREILALRQIVTELEPTRLFEGYRGPGSPVSHLQTYVDELLSGTSIRHAAALSPDSGVWAATDSFPAASQQDARALIKAFESSGSELGALFGLKSNNMQVTFAGGKYDLRKPVGRKDVLVGRGKNKEGKDGGIVVRRGKTLMVAATFDEMNVEGVCEQRVVELGEYMDSLTTEAYVGRR